MNAPKGRETIYKGTRFKSRLEADFAGWLDKQGWQWEYEPRAYAADILGEHVQYLPDFRVVDEANRVTFAEVKPHDWPIGEDEGRAHLYPLLARMQIIWEAEPEAELALVLRKWGAGHRVIVQAAGDTRVWRYISADVPLKLVLPGMGQWAAIADRRATVLQPKAGAVGE